MKLCIYFVLRSELLKITEYSAFYSKQSSTAAYSVAVYYVPVSDMKLFFFCFLIKSQY